MYVEHDCGYWFEFFDGADDEDLDEDLRLRDFVVYTEDGEQLFVNDPCPGCTEPMKRGSFTEINPEPGDFGTKGEIPY